jgi:lysophospholipase L1-like esterase
MKSSALLLLTGLTFAALGFSADAPVKKRILLLGDSISIGYTPMVQKMMAEKAEVIRPTKANGTPENCSGTTAGVQHLDRWLKIGGGKWDVIHFNWGLHDLKHVDAKGVVSKLATDPPQATVEVYENHLREIVTKLKATGAKLIFATTTPVPADPEGKISPYRSDADVVRYNEAALRVMKENNIAVDDLYSFVKPRLTELQLPNVNVHFTPAGSQALAEQVVQSLTPALQ